LKEKRPEIGVEFFARNTLEVAQALLGKRIRYRGCSGIIVETEAYRDDPASHWVRKPKSGRLLQDTFGRIYIFFIYGKHFCLNFTTEREGVGAVLIRAIEPREGIEVMKQRRKTNNLYELTNGPGKLCQAFGIGMELLGRPVGELLKIFPEMESPPIQRSPRIGISKAKGLKWRFFMPRNPFVSRRVNKVPTRSYSVAEPSAY
jgi:DNA-3-methyladenine glycosylase